MKSVCKDCGKEIEHNGSFWSHVAWSPRHPAIPKKHPVGVRDEDERTKSGLVKHVEFQTLKELLDQEIKNHSVDLVGVSGRGPDWEDGFVSGLSHVLRIIERLRRDVLQ